MLLTAQDTLDLVEFRPGTVDDVEGLVGLYEEFFHFSDLPNLGITFSRQNASEWARRVISTGVCPHIVAIDKTPPRSLVGSIGYMIDYSATEPFASMDKFYVRVGWRLSAIGRVLLELATDAARADGAIAFRAGLSAGAPFSKNLFLKLGFAETPGSVLMARRL